MESRPEECLERFGWREPAAETFTSQYCGEFCLAYDPLFLYFILRSLGF